MKYDKKAALSVIFNAAELYEKNLRDNNILFVYWDKHKRIQYLEVEFNASNFMHLTGVKVSKQFKNQVLDSKEYANKFYEKCIKKRLSVNDFNFAEDGTTPLKLDVLPMLMKKNLSANAIGNIDVRTVKLYTEKIAGSIKGCIGFVKDEKVNKNIPNTVLKADIRNYTDESKRIIITYRKKKQDKQYSEIVYTAKAIEWDKVIFPKEIDYLPKP